MPSRLVEKKAFLCYPFDHHVATFTAEDQAYHSRDIVAIGRGYVAVSQEAGLPGRSFCYMGKRRYRSGAFRARHIPIDLRDPCHSWKQ